ncbi:MAG: 2-phospho-L-lactate transferase CofD family protein [Solirubrobacterales bacterium]
MSGGPVVVLAGGTGGAKLARGMLDLVGDGLVVVANTGDDIDIYGAAVSPDPDLVAFTLADIIDSRGWGIDGDAFEEMERRRAQGEEIWFNLGDRDLGWCRRRRELLDDGLTPTGAMAQLAGSLGLGATVLPMTDQPVRTEVSAGGRKMGLQEFLIREQGTGPIEAVAFAGIEDASPTGEVLEAVADARAIVIGPSNPVISIGPILALEGMKDALAAAAAPVVAVSPIVGGRVLKGPTAECLAAWGLPATTAGVARAWEEVADLLVADEPAPGAPVPVKVADTLMDTPQRRRATAREALEAADALSVQP